MTAINLYHILKPYKNINLKFYHCLGNHDYGQILFNHIVPEDYKHQIEYTKYLINGIYQKRS